MRIGYDQAGQVWRADISSSIVQPDHKADDERRRQIDTDMLFVPVDCTIPMGHKAWLYGPQDSRAGTADLMNGLAAAHERLRANGITSANYFSTKQALGRRLGAALSTYYDPRKTRLYSLDLWNMPKSEPGKPAQET